MIELTRLNGQRFRVNCDLIKSSEASPDTVLTLVTGEKMVVTESPAQVAEAIVGYRAEVLRAAWPDAATAFRVKTLRAAVGEYSADAERAQ
jgi:flagellar protein FlbD